MQSNLVHYLTENQVSSITGIPIPTLRNQRHLCKGIPYYKLTDSRHVRYKYSDVISYMESNRIDPTLRDK